MLRKCKYRIFLKNLMSVPTFYGVFLKNRVLTPKNVRNIKIQDFFTYAIRGASCTKQAFSRQRGKLKPEFFHSCNRVLLSCFYRHYDEHAKRWKGNLLLAVECRSSMAPRIDP